MEYPWTCKRSATSVDFSLDRRVQAAKAETAISSPEALWIDCGEFQRVTPTLFQFLDNRSRIMLATGTLPIFAHTSLVVFFFLSLHSILNCLSLLDERESQWQWWQGWLSAFPDMTLYSSDNYRSRKGGRQPIRPSSQCYKSKASLC